MSLLSEVFRSFEPEEVAQSKELFWSSTNMANTFLAWFNSNSDRFTCQREQIRFLSVFSCDPAVDKKIISIFQNAFARFRYVCVEPVNDMLYRTELDEIRHSPIQSIEVSPYPSYITLDTTEKFDLIVLFGLPTNHDLCDYLIRKTKLLLREGGISLIMVPNDSVVTEYSLILHKEMIQHGFEPSSIMPMTIEDISTILDSSSTLYHKCILPSQLNIEGLMKRSHSSELLLSTLLNMDIRDIQDDLYNTIVNKLSSFKVDVTSFLMNFSFMLFFIIGEGVTADTVRKPLDPTPTPWFPQGEQGPFRNIGEEHWKDQLEKWRKKDVYTMPPPLPHISEEDEEEILDLICEMETPSFELPTVTPLCDLLALYNEEWERADLK